MNKYEKQINELKNEYDEAYNEYKKEIGKAYREAQTHCMKYNDQINRINATKDNLLEGISVLHKFLRRIGTIDKNITPFDYVAESSRFVDKEVLNSSRFDNESYSTSAFIKTAPAAAIVTVPAIFPVIWTGDAIVKRSKDKKELARMTIELEEEKNKWDKSVEDKKNEAEFYKDAAQIAFLYQSLILTVRQAIKETILPELMGIDAFLTAEAIKNCIISDMNPNEAEIPHIDLYKDTVYDCHYTFVMNAFDYYNTIVKIFTTPILTNIVSDNQVTDEEKRDFEKKCKMIEAKTHGLAQEAVFGGDN